MNLQGFHALKNGARGRKMEQLLISSGHGIEVVQESDLSDSEVPARSPSRLGFNDAVTVQSEDFPMVELDQKLNVDEKDEMGILEDDEFTEIFLGTLDSSSSFEQEDDSSSELSNDEHGISTLSSDTSIGLPSVSDEPLICPISPNRAAPTLPTPPRLNYTHRGLSRHALIHRKLFWNARQEDWAAEMAATEAEAELALKPYGGIAVLPGTVPGSTTPVSRRGSSSPNLDDRKESTSRRPSFNINAPIYPRNGDISALRDPYSAMIDRCFCQFPLWTIHKSLFMFDMHHRSTNVSVPDYDAAEIDEMQTVQVEMVDSEGDDESISTSTSFSDGDITLVNSGDPFLSPEEQKAFETEVSSQNEKGSMDSQYQGVRAWELTWYARWQLLIELVKRDDALIKRTTPPDGLATEEDSCLPPKFYFAEQDGEEPVSDDEEDDYGTIVDVPMFSASE